MDHIWNGFFLFVATTAASAVLLTQIQTSASLLESFLYTQFEIEFIFYYHFHFIFGNVCHFHLCIPDYLSITIIINRHCWLWLVDECIAKWIQKKRKQTFYAKPKMFKCLYLFHVVISMMMVEWLNEWQKKRF